VHDKLAGFVDMLVWFVIGIVGVYCLDYFNSQLAMRHKFCKMKIQKNGATFYAAKNPCQPQIQIIKIIKIKLRQKNVIMQQWNFCNNLLTAYKLVFIF
jgi:hypothetical protein